MKVLIGITYYFPNISGLTIYAKRLSEGLVQKGHRVTVLASKHQKNLKNEEKINGIRIKRSFVLFRLGKGVFMPLLPFDIYKLAKNSDVIVCNLPQFESFLFAIIGKLLRKKVLLTHHTDLSGWSGFFNRIAEGTAWFGQIIAGVFADYIVPYTKDYADSSWYLGLFRKKLIYIYPPIKTNKVDKALRKRFLSNLGEPKYVIGFAGRIAKQKGIPHLLNAIKYLKKDLVDFKIVFAGPYKTVVGERHFDEINQLIIKYIKYLHFIGDVEETKMSTFYSLCDVLVLPSDDTLESFGIVQVEAMLNKVPVVASNLPGVRVPIEKTGMGMIVPPARPKELAKKIVKVINERKKYIKPREKIEKIFDIDNTLASYERLFKEN